MVHVAARPVKGAANKARAAKAFQQKRISGNILTTALDVDFRIRNRAFSNHC
jgi:hypothetical protein